MTSVELSNAVSEMRIARVVAGAAKKKKKKRNCEGGGSPQGGSAIGIRPGRESSN